MPNGELTMRQIANTPSRNTASTKKYMCERLVEVDEAEQHAARDALDAVLAAG